MLFYANDGLVASPKSSRIQAAFDVLTGLFDHVGIMKNEGKTVIMACHPCKNPHAWSTEAYIWRVMGRGLLYRERLHRMVNLPNFRVNLAAGLLTSHPQRKYGVGRGEATPLLPQEGSEGEGRGWYGIPAQYRMSFPTILARFRCSVEGCRWSVSSRTNLQVQFSCQHP